MSKKIHIADYVWYRRWGKKWQVWSGNPFCVAYFTIPIEKATEKELIKKCKESNAAEKKRFTKLFPVTWEVLTRKERL